MDICCVRHGSPDNGIRLRKDVNSGEMESDSLPYFLAGSCIDSPPAFRDIGAIKFIFEIDGMNDSDVEELNSERADVVERMKLIKERGCSLRYVGMRDEAFCNDLMMIASDVPEIVGASLIELYMNGVGGTEELARILTEKNPSGYNDPEAWPFYPIRIGCFLHEMAAGVDAADVFWVGVEDTNGRHMRVKETGETVYYKIYSTYEFKKHLLKNTSLIIPATYERASVERTDDGRYTIDLGMQLLFSPRTGGPSSIPC